MPRRSVTMQEANTQPQTTTFVDSKGRKWSATVDVPTVKAIRNALNIDLLELLNGKDQSLRQLIEDPIMLVDALYLVCRDQCNDAGIDDNEFGRGLYGEGIDNAVDAFLVGLAYFFPKGRREIVLGVIRKMNESLDRVMAKALAALEDPRVMAAVDRESDQAVEQWLTRMDNLGTGGKSSTS
ncbi:hypothetical protein ACYFX5_09180 [Bremerella sp. T1]|uniref:hypothetical protein n=1 Tax=Bremerella sp. TYQ1 TaxID=3119568 RepID=UPI001CCFF5F2|nr:hypothetical protein [Bremerella volcania]UBM38425.1 hypothetical protein LA756_11115 [Bremerella volcania]